ncbi:MAG TPA: histidine kinase [Gaiellaceae bacterium]|nr:histidine kinase [Gaiellaceae bacterium]
MGVYVLPSFARLRQTSGDVPWAADVVIALALLATSLTLLTTLARDTSPVFAAVCCLVLAGSVAVRRRTPLMATTAALVGLVGYELTTHDGYGAVPPVAVALTFYSVGRAGMAHGQRLLTGLVAGLGLAAAAIVSTAVEASAVGVVVSWLFMAIAPLALGVVLARRSAMSVRLADVAAQLRAEQGLHAAQATSQERNRVARDLHDVVAHCVSVMVVQAGAARLVAARDPAQADQALAVIGDCGRDALADLRRIVGVLHRDADPDFGCGAGLVHLHRLIERIDATGVRTHVRVDGATPLLPALDVVAYQVVQEALTNVVKHAGAGATAVVRVSTAADMVTVEVTNTAGAGAQQLSHSGQGLLGMRERVGAYGGDLEFGPTAARGYSVRVRIPFRAALDRDAVSILGDRRIGSLWRARSVRAVDLTIVVGWLVALEIDAATNPARSGPWILNAAAVAAMALAAMWRRRSPLLFLAVVAGLATALSGGLTSLDRSSITGLYSLVVPLFTVAAWQGRRNAALGVVFWAAGAGSIAALRAGAFGGFAGALGAGIVVWAAGRAVRAQRLLTADLTETTERLAEEREHRAELAVATERTRIARQLHGLVARGVVTMVVQAEAARNLLRTNPDDAAAAIRAIEQTGRDALAQLRLILGVLRSRAGAIREQVA